MSSNHTQTAGNKIIADARSYKADREKGYREQALKLYPWVCGRCAREFIHKNLQELTVHHKNHNHDHDDNPSNGSNWELLCLYCHDNEHSRYEEQVRYGSNSTNEENHTGGTHNPFANLKGLLTNK